MEIDMMTRFDTWENIADVAKSVEAEGFSGMLFTESGQVPWMMITAAALAAPSLHHSTGIAVAFPRSPMISAQVAWELAGNTKGKFRLGLGSQVKPHIERRYSAEFDAPARRMRDYMAAVKACIRAFRREERLDYQGEFYQMNLLPAQWSPARHDYEDVKIDMSAVNPLMLQVTGELADGLHVHPMHSMAYLNNRVLPALAKGAAKTGRSVNDIDLIIPVLAVAGDTPEERAGLDREARRAIGFYGSTKGYGFQFDDLGYEDARLEIAEKFRAGDQDAVIAAVSDEMLDTFGLVARWDDMADKLLERYSGMATRIVMYLAKQSIQENPENLGKWGEIARAVRAG